MEISRRARAVSSSPRLPCIALIALLFVSVGGGPATLRAQTYYYWDNILGTSAGQGGTGTWNTTTDSRWATTAFNQASLPWTSSNNSIAVFQGTPGTVTASGSFTAGGFWTRVGGYTVDVTGITFNGPSNTPYPSFVTDTGTTVVTGTIAIDSNHPHLIKSGAGTLTLAGSFSKNLDVEEGTLEIASTATLGSSAAIHTGYGATLRVLSGATLPSTIVLYFGGGTIETQSDLSITQTGIGNFIKTGAGKLTVSNVTSFTGANVMGGTLRVEMTNGPQAIANDMFIGTRLELVVGFEMTYAERFSGGQFIKEGAAKLILTGENTNNSTVIQAGTLQLGNGGTTGNLFNGELDPYNGHVMTTPAQVTNNGRLSFNRSDTFTAGYTISGTGDVTQDGSGVVVLTGTNSYSGGTTVNAGTVQWSSLSNFGSGNITLNGGGLRWANGNTVDVSSRLAALGANGATVDTNGNNVTLATGISGTGGITKTGSGTLTLSGASSYAGNTTITGGTLALGSTSIAASSRIALNGGTLTATSGGATLANSVSLAADSTIGGSQPLTIGGAFTLNGFKSLTVTNTAQTTISGAVGETSPSIFIKQGSGELQLTGANTYSGGTFIQAGTVRINNSTGSAFGTGAVTVASGATLAGSGSFSGALQLNGTYAPGNSPGTASTGSQTWAGGGAYLWEINDAAGSAGSNPGWDWMNISGALTITATQSNPFLIDLTSLTLADVAGDAAHFTAPSYTFTIATASGGISGFSADKFTLDTSGFTNAGGGTWSLTQSGNSLNLVYATSAVPEPSTYAALAGLAALGAVLRRRLTRERARHG